MFELISSILKYIFAVIIYLFIFGVIRLIYLDIKSMNARKTIIFENRPYLKLINQREALDFKIEETYVLKERMSVGRKNSNDIVVKDPFISGKHAEFAIIDGEYTLRDLGSTNGTFLNGAQLDDSKVFLHDGDKIHIGQVDFLYVRNIEDSEDETEENELEFK